MPKSDDKVGYKQPPKHAQWKKGVSGNPDGARAHNPLVKALKNLTVETYREIIEVTLTGNLKALKAIAEHPDTPAIQVGVATCFMKALQAGDYTVIERIAERLIGKIPDEINLTAKTQNLNANINVTVDKDRMKAQLAKLESDI